jgi:hypothetical protein
VREIEYVAENDPLSAEHYNRLIDAATRPVDGIGVAAGQDGVAVTRPPAVPFQVFELTDDPELDDDAREWTATASPVYRRPVEVDSDGHWVEDAADGSDTKDRHRTETDEEAEDAVWFPSNMRDQNAEPLEGPCVQSGDRVLAMRVAERWEVVCDPCRTIFVELEDDYYPESSTGCTCTIVDNPSERQVTVYWGTQDGIGRLGIGRSAGPAAGGLSHAGTLAYARWNARRSRFEFVSGQFKVVAAGKTGESIDFGEQGDVVVWWKDYVTDALVSSGHTVQAWNWSYDPSIDTDIAVVIHYDPHEDWWYIGY